MIGSTISHYTILSLLGEGGMGVVYKAEDTKLHRVVALKMLPPHLLGDDDVRQRLLYEAQAAAALDHPNVCAIHSIGEHEGRQFIEMEYVDGVTLRQRLARGPLEVNEAIEYAIQIGEAIQEAHASGIIHRDIKSDNIMIDNRGRIKVMDFGLAKLKGASNLTRSGGTPGTLAYMAPEQIQSGNVDARTDLFSFGVVFFEMLTGHFPFRGKHEAAMMYSILNEAPLPLEGVHMDSIDRLQSIIRQCLEKRPQDRYSDMRVVIDDLRPFLRERKISIAAEDKPSRPLLRKHLVKLFIAAGVVLGLAMIWILLRSHNPAPDSGSSSNLMMTAGRVIDTLFFDVVGSDSTEKGTEPWILDSVRLSSLPKVISAVYPYYVVVTGSDLEKRLARSGKLIQLAGIRDWDVHLRKYGMRAYLMVILKMHPSRNKNRITIRNRFVRYTDSGYNANEWRSDADISCASDTIASMFAEQIESDRKSAKIGTILTFSEDRFIFRLESGSAAQRGMPVEIHRPYQHNTQGYQQFFMDIEQQIRYLREAKRWENELAKAMDTYEWLKNKQRQNNEHSQGFGVNLIVLGIDGIVTDVFDSTAIGRITMQPIPWTTPRAGDDIYPK